LFAAIRAFTERHPSWAYVAPFAVFLFFLAAGPRLGLGPELHYPLRVLATLAALLAWSRNVLVIRFTRPARSLLLGAAVFLVWIAPDLLFPGYRSHWLLQNALTGPLASSLSSAHRADPVFLFWRGFGLIVLVPVIEELFWRAWLMRYLISHRFQEVPLGTYARTAFWTTAVLFAAEHGPFWDVGLLAGIAYNAWMIRSRSLGDCILAHAATNALLGAYVLLSGRWEYLL
jgi:CAAX prenyl protease-like protein